MLITTEVVKHSHGVGLVNSYVQSVPAVFMSILFPACVLTFVLPVKLLRRVHLRPTVILRVDAHSVNGSRKHVPCCHTSAHGSGACCFVYGPRELVVLWSSSVAVIGWRNLFSD